MPNEKLDELMKKVRERPSSTARKTRGGKTRDKSRK